MYYLVIPKHRIVMARTTATFSVSLPPEMVVELERVRKDEHRTRSELVREALRSYIRQADRRSLKARVDELPEAEPTAEELEAIREGRAEFRRGKHRTLNELRHDLHGTRRQSRAKKS
jgi:Arc/MetJ-type ribon-helix-helix transcriptional regulator